MIVSLNLKTIVLLFNKKLKLETLSYAIKKSPKKKKSKLKIYAVNKYSVKSNFYLKTIPLDGSSYTWL